MIYGDELVVVLFIFGIEGLLKGVMLMYNNIFVSEWVYCVWLNLIWQDVFMMFVLFGYVMGFLYGVIVLFLIGVCSVLLDIFIFDVCFVLFEQQCCICMFGVMLFVYDFLNLLEK